MEQWELAAELGIHPSELSNYETGKRERLPSGMGWAEYDSALEVVSRRKAAA